jgi:hypothetical protein
VEGIFEGQHDDEALRLMEEVEGDSLRLNEGSSVGEMGDDRSSRRLSGRDIRRTT